jgi:hypothetical protein
LKCDGDKVLVFLVEVGEIAVGFIDEALLIGFQHHVLEAG